MEISRDKLSFFVTFRRFVSLSPSDTHMRGPWWYMKYASCDDDK